MLAEDAQELQKASVLKFHRRAVRNDPVPPFHFLEATMAISPYQLARERAETEHLRQVGDDDLVRVVLGSDVKLTVPVSTLARSSSHEIAVLLGVSRSRAVRLVTAFELGRRGAWNPPHRGDCCLDPAAVYTLMRDLAHEEAEEFHIILLDVRGRLLGRRLISRGSLTQCPVSPRTSCAPRYGKAPTASSSSTTIRRATRRRASTTWTSRSGCAPRLNSLGWVPATM